MGKLVSWLYKPVPSFGNLIWVPRLMFVLAIIGVLDDWHGFVVMLVAVGIKPVLVAVAFSAGVMLVYHALLEFRDLWRITAEGGK